MKLNELSEKAKLKALNSVLDIEISGVLITDIVSDVVTHAGQGTLIVTAQIHNTLVSAAKLVDASAIIFTMGREPQHDVINLAEKANITLFSTPLTAYEIAASLNKLRL